MTDKSDFTDSAEKFRIIRKETDKSDCTDSAEQFRIARKVRIDRNLLEKSKWHSADVVQNRMKSQIAQTGRNSLE